MPSTGSIASPISNLFGSSSNKGSSKAENSIANSNTDFLNTLHNSFGTTFAGQQNIINGLVKSAQNTVNAGPSQFGFSGPELSALNTMANTTTAQGYQASKAAAGAAEAAAGAGSAVLPTGAAAGVNAKLAETAEQQRSNALLGIQEAGYNTGRQNYNAATGVMENAAQLENPSGYANAANTAGENAFGEANTINKENQAANPWPAVGGLVGSLAGTALNMVDPGAGTVLSKVGSGLAGLNTDIMQGYQNADNMPGPTDNYMPGGLDMSLQPLQTLSNLPSF